MNTYLEKKLFKKYPRLFQDKDLDMRKTCMCWGIECADGWYTLLDQLCHCIEEHFWNKENHKLWKDNKSSIDFDTFKQDLSKTEYARASQVKEKYGGLRFYMTEEDDYVGGLIRLAEGLSYYICEKCGNPGRPNRGGWVTTLCDKCKNENDGV